MFDIKNVNEFLDHIVAEMATLVTYITFGHPNLVIILSNKNKIIFLIYIFFNSLSQPIWLDTQ